MAALDADGEVEGRERHRQEEHGRDERAGAAVLLDGDAAERVAALGAAGVGATLLDVALDAGRILEPGDDRRADDARARGGHLEVAGELIDELGA